MLVYLTWYQNLLLLDVHNLSLAHPHASWVGQVAPVTHVLLSTAPILVNCCAWEAVIVEVLSVRVEFLAVVVIFRRRVRLTVTHVRTDTFVDIYCVLWDGSFHD